MAEPADAATKTCPHCGNTIWANATRCQFCQAELGKKDRTGEIIRALAVLVVGLMIAGFMWNRVMHDAEREGCESVEQITGVPASDC